MRLLPLLLLVGCAAEGPATSGALVDAAGHLWAATEGGLGTAAGVVVREGEPAGVAPWGDGVAVSLRTEGAVAFLDADGVEFARVAVGAEPTGVVGGTSLTVAASLSDEVVRLDEDGVLERLAAPGEPRWLARAQGWIFVAGARSRTLLWGGRPLRPLAPPRVEADADGQALSWTPRFTGDPAVSPGGDEVVFPLLYVNHSVPVGSGGYDRVAGEPRFRPALWRVHVDGRGPVDRGLVELRPVRGEDGVLRGGLVSSVAFSPDGRLAAALGTGDGLLVLDWPGGEPELTVVPGGPSGVAWSDGWWVLAGRAGRVDGVDGGGWSAAAPLHPEHAEGRRLFETSADVAISGPGSGLSCSTCHIEGRTDGLTWALGAGPRQTPSLAGPTSDTTPLTWTGAVGSVAVRALETSARRMGGLSLSADQADAVAGWIDAIRAPVLPAVDEAAAARGRLLFEDPVVGCADCHPAPTFADGQAHSLFGLKAVDTPSLRGVAATPPYIHDGSSPTLSSVLDRSRRGDMGDTGGLDAGELADLEAWLRSL